MGVQIFPPACGSSEYSYRTASSRYQILTGRERLSKYMKYGTSSSMA